MRYVTIVVLAALLGGCSAAYVGQFQGISPKSGVPEGAKTLDLSVNRDNTWQAVVTDKQGNPLKSRSGVWREVSSDRAELLPDDGQPRVGTVRAENDGVLLQLDNQPYLRMRRVK